VCGSQSDGVQNSPRGDEAPSYILGVRAVLMQTQSDMVGVLLVCGSLQNVPRRRMCAPNFLSFSKYFWRYRTLRRGVTGPPRRGFKGPSMGGPLTLILGPHGTLLSAVRCDGPLWTEERRAPCAKNWENVNSRDSISSKMENRGPSGGGSLWAKWKIMGSRRHTSSYVGYSGDSRTESHLLLVRPVWECSRPWSGRRAAGDASQHVWSDDDDSVDRMCEAAHSRCQAGGRHLEARLRNVAAHFKVVLRPLVHPHSEQPALTASASASNMSVASGSGAMRPAALSRPQNAPLNAAQDAPLNAPQNAPLNAPQNTPLFAQACLHGAAL